MLWGKLLSIEASWQMPTPAHVTVVADPKVLTVSQPWYDGEEKKKLEQENLAGAAGAVVPSHGVESWPGAGTQLIQGSPGFTMFGSGPYATCCIVHAACSMH